MTGKRIRVAAALLIVAVLVVLAIHLVPVYLRNHELQAYVSDMTRTAGEAPDVVLRQRILDKAASLELPVTDSGIQIRRQEDAVKVDVRYVVRVDLPLYTVDLHFYPGAGSR
ncbi:MAG: hypothetical protein IPM24_00465 [Bryobacterales bacterium]|nr:hypothetical protein [Bryobacterales bacterium]